MKQLSIMLIFLSFAFITGIQAQEENRNVSIEQEADTTVYELIIIDTGFDSWLATQLPSSYRTNDYYRSWNNRYVKEWNTRFLTQAIKYPEIENYINYEPTVDYGIDLNYRLYMYFQYFEEKNKISLIRRK